jgi:hypothetical protein
VRYWHAGVSRSQDAGPTEMTRQTDAGTRQQLLTLDSTEERADVASTAV